VLRFVVGAISAALRLKALLVAENLCLRQQLLVLQRRHRQLRLRNGDPAVLDLRQWFTGWRNSFLIVSQRRSRGGIDGVGVVAFKSAAPEKR
jgi:hypothetical protein